MPPAHNVKSLEKRLLAQNAKLADGKAEAAVGAAAKSALGDTSFRRGGHATISTRMAGMRAGIDERIQDLSAKVDYARLRRGQAGQATSGAQSDQSDGSSDDSDQSNSLSPEATVATVNEMRTGEMQGDVVDTYTLKTLQMNLNG